MEAEELAAPSILVAVPHMSDPNFSQKVVVLLEHNDEGSMGLTLNTQTDITMGTFCDSQKMQFKGDRDLHIFQGGPVQTDRAFILHASDHQGPETEAIKDGVRLSYSLESLRLLVEDPPKDMRVYMGYAGWGPDQLASEIVSGAWIVGDFSHRILFEVSQDNLWETALRDMGIDPAQLVHSGALH